MQDLHDAVWDYRLRVEAAGRQATMFAFAHAYGDMGENGLLSYYLASAFDGVYVQPGSLVSLLGARQPALPIIPNACFAGMPHALHCACSHILISM